MGHVNFGNFPLQAAATGAASLFALEGLPTLRSGFLEGGGCTGRRQMIEWHMSTHLSKGHIIQSTVIRGIWEICSQWQNYSFSYKKCFVLNQETAFLKRPFIYAISKTNIHKV